MFSDEIDTHTMSCICVYCKGFAARLKPESYKPKKTSAGCSLCLAVHTDRFDSSTQLKNCVSKKLTCSQKFCSCGPGKSHSTDITR